MKAAEFQYHFNGKPFNSMEPETCHVVYVKTVQVMNSHKDNSVVDSMIPFYYKIHSHQLLLVVVRVVVVVAVPSIHK